jgi:hypothetical protein
MASRIWHLFSMFQERVVQKTKGHNGCRWQWQLLIGGKALSSFLVHMRYMLVVKFDYGARLHACVYVVIIAESHKNLLLKQWQCRLEHDDLHNSWPLTRRGVDSLVAAAKASSEVCC